MAGRELLISLAFLLGVLRADHLARRVARAETSPTLSRVGVPEHCVE